MSRHVTVRATQMGRISRDETREQVGGRLLAFLVEAAAIRRKQRGPTPPPREHT